MPFYKILSQDRILFSSLACLREKGLPQGFDFFSGHRVSCPKCQGIEKLKTVAKNFGAESKKAQAGQGDVSGDATFEFPTAPGHTRTHTMRDGWNTKRTTDQQTCNLTHIVLNVLSMPGRSQGWPPASCRVAAVPGHLEAINIQRAEAQAAPDVSSAADRIKRCCLRNYCTASC